MRVNACVSTLACQRLRVNACVSTLACAICPPAARHNFAALVGACVVRRGVVLLA